MKNNRLRNFFKFPHVRLLTLLLFVCHLSALAQDQKITGTVVDKAAQQPIPGASVVVKGTTIGTVTDFDGNYSISVGKPNASIEFSYLGYQTLEVEVGIQTVINVALEEQASKLDEVVVIGYGSTTKRDLTGAVASVKGEAIAASGNFSAAQAMQGKMSGVQVINNGDAGSESKIRIRGINTIGNNDPLVVIDGITTGASIQDINPSDIKSIDVLKDASSLAIFGSRASNGVIMITTKKGNYGSGKPVVTLDVSSGVSAVTKRLDLVSASQLVDIIDEARTTENTQLGSNFQLYDELWPNDNWARQDVTDWQDEMFRTGTFQDYSLSINGGSDHTTYGFGASYRDQKGTMVGNYANRAILRANFETKVLSDNLKIGGSMNYSQRESRGSAQGSIWGSDIFRGSLTPSSTPAYFADGSPYQETDGAKIAYILPGDLVQNWVVIAEDFSNPTHKVLSNIYADLEIVDGLNIKSSYGSSYAQNFRRSYQVQSLNPQGDPATLAVNSVRSLSYSWDNTLTYAKEIGIHKINLLAGMNTFNVDNNGLFGNRSIFPEGDPEELRYLNFGSSETQTNSERASNVRLTSFFGRVNYSFADKYLLTASIRRDGSSRFHKDVRWGTFPSFSLGWKISDEAFLQDVEWLDLLKIRGSWGQVGNQEVGSDYAYISTVQSGVESGTQQGKTDYIFGENQDRTVGKVIVKRGNENLSWETTTMTNIGLDFSAGKFDGSLEYFYNKTDDILLDSQFPDVAGYTFGTAAITPKVNAGQVDTKGIDFNLNYQDTWGEFQFNAGLVFTYVKNEIISLGDREFVQGATSNYHNTGVAMSRAYEGDPIGSFYGWQVDGIFNSPEEVNAANQIARDRAKAADPNLTEGDLAGIYYISANTGPGDYKFKDNNDDGVITDEDKAFLGSGNPEFNYGVNLGFSYKGIDAAINVSGVSGVQLHALIEPPLSNTAGGTVLSSTLNHWTPDNRTTNFPRYTMTDPNNNLRVSDRWVYNGSYARIQNLILGYTWPDDIVAQTGLGSIRTYLNIQNLYTFTSYPFLDPEVKGTELEGGNYDTTAGVDIGNSPLPRTISLGLNLKF